jgi:hypothetical protein
MTDDPTIVHDAFKQFERDKFSLVAQKYNQAIATVTVDKITSLKERPHKLPLLEDLSREFAAAKD